MGEWAQGTFLRQQRKVPPAHVQQVFIFVDDWAVGLAGVYYSYVDEEPDLLRIMEHS
jgi:hypothetical protein